ncbi:MAG: hypothetical protein L0387_10780 [Acidobacteria bacterium]|nr:hypothetical protein [Acidobacteriota bacterium]
MARQMSCKTVLSLLPAEVSGTITLCDAQGVAEHIRSCRSCAIAYESAREAVEFRSGKGSDGGQGITSPTAVFCEALKDCEVGSGGGK